MKLSGSSSIALRPDAAASSNLPQRKYDNPIAGYASGRLLSYISALKLNSCALSRYCSWRENYWYIWPYALEHAA